MNKEFPYMTHSTDCHVCHTRNVVSNDNSDVYYFRRSDEHKKRFRMVASHFNEVGKRCSMSGVLFDWLMTHPLDCHECGLSEMKSHTNTQGEYWVRWHRNSEGGECIASEKYFNASNVEIKKE